MRQVLTRSFTTCDCFWLQGRSIGVSCRFGLDLRLNTAPDPRPLHLLNFSIAKNGMFFTRRLLKNLCSKGKRKRLAAARQGTGGAAVGGLNPASRDPENQADVVVQEPHIAIECVVVVAAELK